MKVLGIDPGASGAFALYDSTTKRLIVDDMPTVEIKRGQRMVRHVTAQGVAALLRASEPDHVILEKVHAMPGQGVSSMFAFGRASGLVEGVVAAFSLRLTLVTPQEWMKAVRTTGGKDGNRHRAMELFPNEAGLFARVKDDGRADAALMAYFGAHHMSQSND